MAALFGGGRLRFAMIHLDFRLISCVSSLLPTVKLNPDDSSEKYFSGILTYFPGPVGRPGAADQQPNTCSVSLAL